MIELIGLIALVLFLIYGIPQIIKLYKVKDAKQFSIVAWLMLSTAMGLVLLTMLFTRTNLAAVIPYTVNTIEVFWITALVIKYR